MTVAISITEDDVLTTLRSFLMSILDPAVEVIRGQDNRVPEPSAVDFIVMTPTHRERIATNTSAWDYDDNNPSEIATGRGTKVIIQLDSHGPNGADNAQIIATLFRDDYACEYFADTGFDLQPLYSTDGQQIPFENGEGQYEDRWVAELAFQVNLIISTPQDFAATLAVTLIEVDSTYPPGA